MLLSLIRWVVLSFGVWMVSPLNLNACFNSEPENLLHPVQADSYSWGDFFKGFPGLLQAFNPFSFLITPKFGFESYSSEVPLRSSKLMIVAHPDDETLWGGCHLLAEKGWHVISVTNASHKVRRKEFSNAMNYVGASWEIWDHADLYFSNEFHPRLKSLLKEVIHRQHWDMIVSHGPVGEYGHRQHKALYKLVRSLVKKNFWVFDPFSRQPVPQWCKAAKSELLNFYGSQSKTFRAIYHFGPSNEYGADYESFFRAK